MEEEERKSEINKVEKKWKTEQKKKGVGRKLTEEKKEEYIYIYIYIYIYSLLYLYKRMLNIDNGVNGYEWLSVSRLSIFRSRDDSHHAQLILCAHYIYIYTVEWTNRFFLSKKELNTDHWSKIKTSNKWMYTHSHVATWLLTFLCIFKPMRQTVMR